MKTKDKIWDVQGLFRVEGVHGSAFQDMNTSNPGKQNRNYSVNKTSVGMYIKTYNNTLELL